jgi:hypothetical protein
LLVFLKRQNSQPLQEGSFLARNSSTLESEPAPSVAGYTPWRDRPLLQLKTASEIAGVSPASLYRFSDEGKLKLRELGGRTLVDTKSLIALIETAKDWTPKKRGEEARAKRKEVARTALQG